ncbi:MAG TPA: STAS domain-containing protein [Solirubrobacteraceae bacterium]
MRCTPALAAVFVHVPEATRSGPVHVLWGQPPSDLVNRLADFLAPGLAGDQLEILAPAGDVDVDAAAELKRKLSGALDAGRTNVVVDLSAATFLDTTALAAFVAASRRLRSVGGDLLVVNADESIARTFAISGADKFVSVYPSRAAALQAIRSG